MKSSDFQRKSHRSHDFDKLCEKHSALDFFNNIKKKIKQCFTKSFKEDRQW